MTGANAKHILNKVKNICANNSVPKKANAMLLEIYKIAMKRKYKKNHPIGRKYLR